MLRNMKSIQPLLLAIPLLFLPYPVYAQEAPVVSSSVGESNLSNSQCLDRASAVLTELGYGGLSRVGSSTDTSLYSNRGNSTAIIRCVTKFSIAVIIFSTTDPRDRQELNRIADAFFQN
jgi:hypothetical protein